MILTPILVLFGACWSSPAPRPPISNEAPRVADPVLPDPLAAVFGTFDDLGTLIPGVEVPLFGGSTFGWRLDLGCTGDVEVREQLRLPAPGDWGTDPDLTTSDDGRIAEVRAMVPCRDGWIEKIWSLSPGDPPGLWVVRVTAKGFAPQTFRATFTRSPTPLPP